MKRVFQITVFLGILSVTSQSVASALGDLAMSMPPGTFAELQTTGFDAGNLLFTTQGLAGGSISTGSAASRIIDYSESAAWDPVARKLLWIGAPHGGAFKFIIYSEDTNTWTTGPLPYACMNNGIAAPIGIGDGDYCGGHSYDWVTIDQANGLMMWRHHKTGPEIDVFNVRTGIWGQLPLPPADLADSWASLNNIYGAMEFFPEMGSLITVTGGKMFKINTSTNEWTKLPAYSMGGYHNFIEYNSVVKLALFGGGNSYVTGDQSAGMNHEMYKMDAQGTVTKLKNAPIDIRITGTENGSGPGSLFTVDPVSGKFLVFNVARNFYEYDVVADTWILRNSAAPISSHSVATPIAAYGVTLFIAPTAVWLYKHDSGCTSCQTLQPPTAPTGLNVTVQ